jgi:hypothetical protein
VDQLGFVSVEVTAAVFAVTKLANGFTGFFTFKTVANPDAGDIKSSHS